MLICKNKVNNFLSFINTIISDIRRYDLGDKNITSVGSSPQSQCIKSISEGAEDLVVCAASPFIKCMACSTLSFVFSNLDDVLLLCIN